MKVAILLTVVCLLAGTNAQDTGATNIFENLKTALQNTLNHVKDNGKNVLQGLLGQATQAGSQLLQSTLLKLLEGLGTQAPGKRDIETLQKVREMFEKFQAKLKERKGMVGSVVNQSLEKLKAVMEKLGNLSFLKKPLGETTKEIDQAADHYVEVHRRFLEDLGNQLLETLKTTGSQLAQQLLTQVIGGLAGAGKRDLHPALQSLVDFFKPHVQSVVDTAGKLGTDLKGHATNLWNTVQTHAGQLSTKLQGHVDELKQHGQTLLGHGQKAVEALKAAVTDILKQTVTNAKGTLTDASKTVSGASGVITNHLVDALKNTGSSQ